MNKSTLILLFLISLTCNILNAQKDVQETIDYKKLSFSILSYYNPNIRVKQNFSTDLSFNGIYRVTKKHRFTLGVGIQQAKYNSSQLFSHTTNSDQLIKFQHRSEFNLFSMDYGLKYEYGMHLNKKNNLWIGALAGLSQPFSSIHVSENRFTTENNENVDVTSTLSNYTKPFLRLGISASVQHKLKKNSIEFSLRFKTPHFVDYMSTVNINSELKTDVKLIEQMRGSLGFGLAYTFL